MAGSKERTQRTCETDEKVVLLAVMAVNHPAFTFSQKQAIRRQLSALLQAVESETAVEPEGTESQREVITESSKCEESSKFEATGPYCNKIHEGKVLIGRIEMDSLQIRQSDKRYECVFKVHWLDGSVTTICKTHAQLFEFQGKLLQLFPEVDTKERLIPYIPGEVQGKHIFSGAKGRDSTEKFIPKEFLEYASKLSALPKKILHCELMKEFFKGDKSATVSSSSSSITMGTEGSSAKMISMPPSLESGISQQMENHPLPDCSRSNHPHQPQQQQQQQTHLCSTLPQPAHSLTASLQHLDISHHQNINLTPPNPVHISAQPIYQQQQQHHISSNSSSTSTSSSSSAAAGGVSTPNSSSGSNSVYFQTISSAISIPTPTDLYNVITSSSENISVSRQSYDAAALLAKTQGLPQLSPVNYATPLPNTSDAFNAKVISPVEGNPPPPVPANGEVPMVHLQHPHHHQHMLCFTTANSQPLNSTALPKNAVASEIQEWLKKQRLHKYEHLFRGLSVSEVIELTDEDIDKWEIVTTGAKRRFKDHFEQLRQSLLSPHNGLTTPAVEPSQFAVAHPNLTFMPPNYFVSQPGVQPSMVTPHYQVLGSQEAVMSSDNSSSGSGSRESSDECERDSEENELTGFVSQDVRAHCNLQLARKPGTHGPRQHHQSKSRHGSHKCNTNNPGLTSPLPYSQVVKSPISASEGGKKDPRHVSRTVRRGGTPPVIVSQPDSAIHAGQRPTTIIHSTNSLVLPPSPHQLLLSPRVETPCAMDLEACSGSNRPQKSLGNQKVSQPGVARGQVSPVLQMHGPTTQGWYPSPGNNAQPTIGPSSVPGLPLPTSHISPVQQNLTVQAGMDQFNQASSPRMEGPQQTPMVKSHGGRQAGNNNHFSGEEAVPYRTIIMGPGVPMQVNVSSESLQGQVSPVVHGESTFVGSSPAQTNPKGIYTNTANHSGGGVAVPSSHVASENILVSSATTYVQAANQNTVSVVASNLGMMQLAPVVLSANPGPCTCNSNGGNNSNQNCSVHQFQVTNALLPNPPYLPYQSFQNFFQGGVPGNHLVPPINLLKGPSGPGGNARYLNHLTGPSTAIPSEMLYGTQYGVISPQSQVFMNQMGLNQRGPQSPHAGSMMSEGGKKPPLNCFNCGIQGHKASDCRETTMESITQNSQYRMNFKQDTTDS